MCIRDSVLVCNHARSNPDGALGALDAGILDGHWAVDARSTILLAQEFAARHDGRPGGRIVLLTSGQGLGPMPGEIAYAAAKGALAAITATLADQLADAGITPQHREPRPGRHRLPVAGGARGGGRQVPRWALGRARRPGPADRLAGHRRRPFDHRVGDQLRERLPAVGARPD